MTQVFLIVMHLLNGEIAKVPVMVFSNHAGKGMVCDKAVVKVTQENEYPDSGITYKGVDVWAYYCKQGILGPYIH
jgi:hypothetical protein|tara:strand:- start:12 stop:236 length:225 start_codon:yes stop_codon:yes gene_type:complete